eukprot:365863-Chlamydomonas_euryale.AAC.1
MSRDCLTSFLALAPTSHSSHTAAALLRLSTAASFSSTSAIHRCRFLLAFLSLTERTPTAQTAVSLQATRARDAVERKLPAFVSLTERTPTARTAVWLAGDARA